MALIPSHYTMNVARHDGRMTYDGKPAYVHFCAIELGQLLASEAMDKALDIRARFPEPEFKVTLEHVECSGRTIPWTDL